MNPEQAASADAKASDQPLQVVLDLCADDMRRVNEHIREALQSEVVLINQVARHIVSSGGKRLRPMLLILCAHACGYRGNAHIPLASIIEFIHTATLLHDDVVDESETRRGRETAHAVWGNAASVLVGDFLYSRSFQLMVETGSMRVMEILSDATNTIAEGEVLQLLNLGDPEITREAYYRVVENKTAKLFEAACRLGAVIAGADREREDQLAKFGNHLGIAFQVTDDVLDYTGDHSAMGKNIGDDLAEGKPTLPLILARAMSSEAERERIDHAIRNGGDDVHDILAIIRDSGALENAMQEAGRFSELAASGLSGLPESEWSSALASLASYAARRNH